MHVRMPYVLIKELTYLLTCKWFLPFVGLIAAETIITCLLWFLLIVLLCFASIIK